MVSEPALLFAARPMVIGCRSCSDHNLLSTTLSPSSWRSSIRSIYLPPRFLYRLSHLRRHLVQRRRLCSLVEFPRVHHRRRFLIRARVELLHRLNRCPGTQGLVHGFGISEGLGIGLGFVQDDWFPVLSKGSRKSARHP
uniref:Uncharacterized protein n=1 Tax=Nelumbo nucifera TaxID=4432 RepID=A0A822YUS7_NELNU|nr:TPA_asm: hypothetical protein HUJ06_005819 [Nelumbo nucifera]